MSIVPVFTRARAAFQVVSRHHPILIPVLLVGAIAFFVLQTRGELGSAAHSALHADLRWVAIALLCQVVILAMIAENFRRIFQRLGHDISWGALARIHLRRHAVATLVPFGGPGSYVLFVRDLSHRGISGPDTMSAVVLKAQAGQIALAFYVTGALVWLAATARLGVSVWAIAAIAPLTIGWVALQVIAMRTGSKYIGRIPHMPKAVVRFADRLASHNLDPRDLAIPAVLCLGVNLAGIAMLLSALHAVGQSPSIGTLLMVRLAAQLASHAVPVAQGAGMVELSLIGAMQQAGMQASTATAAAVLFRMAQLWVPLAVGTLLLLNMGRIRAFAGPIATAWMEAIRFRYRAIFGRVPADA